MLPKQIKKAHRLMFNMWVESQSLLFEENGRMVDN